MYSNLMSANKLERNVVFVIILFETIVSFQLVECRMQTSSKSKMNAGEKNQGPFKRFNELRCRSAEEDLDRCSAQLIAIGDTFYPRSMEEVDFMYCPSFKQAAECVKNATECYKPFEKQIINWVLTSTRRLNYKRCRNEPEKAKFLKLCDTCLFSMKDSMETCMNDYIANLEGIAEQRDGVEQGSEDDYQIQLSCCANNEFKKCIMDNAKHSCKPTGSLGVLKRTSSLSSNRAARKLMNRESEEMIEELSNALDSMTFTGPELICNSVGSDFCRSKFIANAKRKSGYKSIVVPMLKIYSNK